MTSLKPKPKNKKLGKIKPDSRNYDLSELRKPIEISVSSLKKAANLLENGTTEVKGILTYEVNILYECKICHSIFRSLVNLISHKRRFCPEKANPNFGNEFGADKATASSNLSNEDLADLEIDCYTFDQLENPSRNDRILRSQAPRKSQSKDLTSVLNMLQKKQEEHLSQVNREGETNIDESPCKQVVLQVLDSKRAAYQTLVEPNLTNYDLMENQVMELENMKSQDTVVLGIDGQIEKSDDPVDWYNNDEPIELLCQICSTRFSTKKTLNSHIKIVHAPDRLRYPCPWKPCTDNFTSLASTERHLIKVHRISSQEVKKMKVRIQEKAFSVKDTLILANKKFRKPENNCNNIANNSQEWMDQVDSQIEFYDCIPCGEKFDDKSEFLSHSENCVGQIDGSNPEQNKTFREKEFALENVPDSAEENFGKRLPEIREEVSSETLNNDDKNYPAEIDSKVFENQANNCMFIRVQEVSSLSEEDWENLPSCSFGNEQAQVNIGEIPLTKEVNRSIKRPKTSYAECLIRNSDIVYTSENKIKKRKLSPLCKVNGSSLQGEIRTTAPHQANEAASMESGTFNTSIFGAKIAMISDHKKLECIKCKRNSTSMKNLNRHMKSHMKLKRYLCNKCDFKSVTRNECVRHCNRLHNAMNIRQVLNGMISSISSDQLTFSEDNTHRMKYTLVDTDSQFRKITPVKNILQVLKKRPLIRSVTNLKQNDSYRIISDSIIPSDTDTEFEDSEAVQRKIDSNPNLKEMVMEVVFGSNSNLALPETNPGINKFNWSLSKNNNLEVSSVKEVDYSPPFDEINFNTEVADKEDEISCELYPRDSINSQESRSNSKTGERTNSREKRKSNSRAENQSDSKTDKSGSLSETGNSLRLSKELNSDDENEFTKELNDTGGTENNSRRRSSSQSAKRSSSRMEIRSESRIMTRSTSRLANQSYSGLEDNDNDEDYWNGYSRDLASKEQELNTLERGRCQSRARSKSSLSRVRPQGKPSNKIRSISREREKRSESISSENSQNQRPVRNRVKHVDKDFVYDLEDIPFKKLASNSSGSSSGKKACINRLLQFNRSISRASKRLFNDSEVNVFKVKEEYPSVDSGPDLDSELSAEVFFRGFPRQAPIITGTDKF